MTDYINHKVLLPRNNSLDEMLRFYVQTADPDCLSLDFAVGLWSYYTEFRTLTDKQMRRIMPYLIKHAKRHGISFEED